ncbi:hypothetical protein B0H17DRAFT_1159588 [Mycena rosella]|uniref:DUF1254 domain-containing protein n=1 Tax=Mycena rosella TaxID=1033263 RepID=A0AAD7DJW1_MYCRO|nr:hypothetical protein B0H17DRAFT_1159588 [Mycena rosella]
MPLFQLSSWTTNTLAHETTLANASYHTIVLPNVDTLYSEALIDLSRSDVVATMPSLEAGRFYVWPFYDLYGNNFCNIGTETNSTAGKYLIKFRPSNPGCTAASGEYKGIIYMPTVYGASLLRIEVSNTSDANYVVASIQPGFRLSALPSYSPLSAPPLTQALLNGNLTTNNSPLYIMQLTARLAAYNPPEVAADVASVTFMLETAGISMTHHTYTTPSGVDLSQAFAAAQALMFGIITAPGVFESLGNGWAEITPALCGDFHSRYDVRAFIAVQAYLQLQASQALYPTFELSETLFANQTYMLQFFGKPQINGFWSLTMYDGDGFLVPNSLNRYSLNNRGNLTYPDGQLVYGDGSPADSAEDFYMLLQSTDSAVSPEWESNWLPTPAAGGAFRFYLRFYGPTDTLLDGEYTYPNLTAVAVNPPLPSSS